MIGSNRVLDAVGGLKLGVILSIPFWVVLGAFVVSRSAAPTADEILSSLLVIAVVVEAILVRSLWRFDLAPWHRAVVGSLGSLARRFEITGPVLRRALALGALEVSYLGYYFCDVNLQIASMHSMVVFVPVQPLTTGVS